MNRAFVIVATVGFVCMGSALAQPTVTYTLKIDEWHLGPNLGWFTVTARASLGDNAGLASYKVSLAGWDVLYHVGPEGTITDGGSSTKAIGFSLLRSPGNDSPLTGSQDTVTPGAAMTYGIGQTATELTVPAGWMFDTYPLISPFAAPDVIIAVGTYSGQGPQFENDDPDDIRATVFQNDQSVAVYEAETVLVPEPTCLAVLLLGSIGLRRRRA